MIKDKNIADDAQIQLHKIMGSAGMLITGDIFWVGTNGTAAYLVAGGTWVNPTIA